MVDSEAHRLRRLEADLQRRREWFPRVPTVGELLSSLLARRGYGQGTDHDRYAQAWSQVVGPDLATDSRPGRLRSGVLRVWVRNSTALQELTMRKHDLVEQLRSQLDDSRIRDVRFELGAFDE